MTPTRRDAEPQGAEILLAGERFEALSCGALFWPARRLLAAADLHLGKCARAARSGGALLPPYETAETLARLEAAIAARAPETVALLGDSFDDAAAAARLDAEARARLAAMARGRRWIWIAGNHDPGPTARRPEAREEIRGAIDAEIGERRGEFAIGPIRFRHHARADAPPAGTAEMSGHYHPKAVMRIRGRQLSRRCFLYDARRVILPAFGAYSGGLDAADPALSQLLAPDAAALTLGAPMRRFRLGALCAERGLGA